MRIFRTSRNVISILGALFAVGCMAAPPSAPMLGKKSATAGTDDLQEQDPEEMGSENDSPGSDPVDPPPEQTDPPETTPEPETPMTGTPTTPVPPEVVVPVPEPVVMKFLPKLSAVAVKASDDSAPTKGKGLKIKLSWINEGALAGKLTVTPIISAQGFTGAFKEVTLPSQQVDLAASQKLDKNIDLDVFFADAVNKKQFALGSGKYSLSFKLAGDGVEAKTIRGLAGSDLTVAKSKAVLSAVLWNANYLARQSYPGTIDQYMRESFTRKSEISDGNNSKVFNKGYEEMMGVSMHFKTFDNSELDTNSGDGVEVLNSSGRVAQGKIGLSKPFVNSSIAHPDNHGFDLAIMLTGKATFGGWAWPGGSISASSVFEADRSKGRSQMVLVHEVGHNWGAPHCDPIQGYVMCSGEKHERYKNGGSFVWHQSSIDVMKKTANVNAVGTFEAASEPELHDCYFNH